MFSRNHNINSVLTDKLPALRNSHSMSDYVFNLLALLKMTRTRYIHYDTRSGKLDFSHAA